MDESRLTEVEALKLQVIRTTRTLAQANIQTGQLLIEKLNRDEADLLAEATANLAELDRQLRGGQPLIPSAAGCDQK